MGFDLRPATSQLRVWFETRHGARGRGRGRESQSFQSIFFLSRLLILLPADDQSTESINPGVITTYGTGRGIIAAVTFRWEETKAERAIVRRRPDSDLLESGRVLQQQHDEQDEVSTA